METYISQQRTICGVIFHYANVKTHEVSSLFYTDEELTDFARVGALQAPHIDDALKSIS